MAILKSIFSKMPIMRILLTCSGMGTRMKSSVGILKPVKVMMNVKSSRPEVSIKKVFLKFLQNSQENTCARVSFLIKLQAEACNCNFIKKETLAQVFSYKFFEISKNTFSYRKPLAVSGMYKMPGKLQ